ncbi:hypothetical protein HPT27_03165 [Permianibacter sp. IMCC34836]|uniref:hypothetical protein n=1 Tax=Permianibacter fluminis TaxID=2738515 RepID=UPI001554E95C|nr:hypothetical protein [Permianibacter fluminis]NQD36008.1 hypothetical protein [Permianibacter fluminis]
MLVDLFAGGGLITPEKPPTSAIRWGNPTVRDPMSRSKETVRAWMNDPKARRFIATESGIERRFVLSVLYWSVAAAIQEQALEVRVPGPEPFSAFPDFLLTLKSGRKLVIEIKAAERLAEDESLRRRLTRVAHALAEHGLLYSVVTEHDFSAAYHLSNLIQLKPYLSYAVPQLPTIVDAVYRHSPANFGQLAAVTGDRQVALALIAQKYVSASLQSPLVDETPISPGGHDEPPHFDGWHPTDGPWQAMEDRQH